MRHPRNASTVLNAQKYYYIRSLQDIAQERLTLPYLVLLNSNYLSQADLDDLTRLLERPKNMNSFIIFDALSRLGLSVDIKGYRTCWKAKTITFAYKRSHFLVSGTLESAMLMCRGQIDLSMPQLLAVVTFLDSTNWGWAQNPNRLVRRRQAAPVQQKTNCARHTGRAYIGSWVLVVVHH